MCCCVCLSWGSAAGACLFGGGHQRGYGSGFGLCSPFGGREQHRSFCSLSCPILGRSGLGSASVAVVAAAPAPASARVGDPISDPGPSGLGSESDSGLGLASVVLRDNRAESCPADTSPAPLSGGVVEAVTPTRPGLGAVPASVSVSAGCPAPEPGSSDPSPGVDAEPGSSPGVSRDSRDVSGAASTAPVPSSGGTGEAAGSAVVGTGRNAEEDTPSSDGVRDSSSWVVAQEDESFVDAVHFIRAVHGLQPPRGGPGSSMGQVWTMALLKGNQCSPFALPLSARSVSLRERTDACLASMGSKRACSFIYPPPVRDHRFYQPSDRRFGAPLSISSDLVNLSSLQGLEMRSVSVSVPHHLLTSLEVSAGATCETSSWLDWWTTSLSGFLDDLLLDKRSLFQGLVSAGDRTLQHVSQHAVSPIRTLCCCIWIDCFRALFRGFLQTLRSSCGTPGSRRIPRSSRRR